MGTILRLMLLCLTIGLAGCRTSGVFVNAGDNATISVHGTKAAQSAGKATDLDASVPLR